MKFFFILISLLFSHLAWSKVETFTAGRFGQVTIYGAEKTSPSQFIMFLSGEDGWNASVADVARSLENPDNVIVGISTRTYLKNLLKSKEKCHYSAADLESLSHLLQLKYKFKEYIIPTLMGYAQGASLAYGVLVQAPTNTFRGAVSVGFCPDIELDKPLCKGNGLIIEPIKKTKKYLMKPYLQLKQPWVVLHGNTDPACSVLDQNKFSDGLPNASWIELPKSGSWVPQLKEVFNKFLPPEKALARDPAIQDLPVEELFVEEKQNNTLVVILSGDGGWSSLDKDLARAFNEQGYSVVGLNSLKYFWHPKTAEVIGSDMERIGAHYTNIWKKNKILWVGYSMGADVMAFGLNKATDELKKKSLAAVYIGLSKKAEFEFNFSNWLSTGSSEEGKPTKPEILKLSAASSGIKNICIYGAEEDDSGCEDLIAPVKVIKLPGGHHFGGDYEKIASLILKSI